MFGTGLIGSSAIVSQASAATTRPAQSATNGLEQLVATRTNGATSSNWSGYAATGRTYTYAYGTWVVPKANCGTVFNGFVWGSVSSSWVGLDGADSATVEQTGTETDCSWGQGSYSAWYETYPSDASQSIPNQVKPGDSMAATVTYEGNKSTCLQLLGRSVCLPAEPEYLLQLKNITENWTYSTYQFSPGAQNASAEWVTEQPTTSPQQQLTNFGTVPFNVGYATGNGVFGKISTFPNQPINMVSGSTVKSTTSGLNAAGWGFTTTFEHS
jgi:hypothetical protein